MCWEGVQIKRPDNVRTCVFSCSAYGGAPLLHNKAFTTYSYFYPAIASKNKENFGSKSAKTGILALSPLMDLITSVTLTHKNLPDIIIGIKGKNTSEIYAMVFHETTHYSHKNQVSNGFWANVQYQAMFDETKGTYEDESPNYSSYTGVAEAWSNFIEYQLMANNNLLRKGEYSINMTAYSYESKHYASTIPSNKDNAADFARWILSGLPRDLMDSKHENLKLLSGTDYKSLVYEGKERVSGFTYKQIYYLLTEDVASIPRLRDKIIRQYPNINSNKEITELFKLYGY